MKLVNRDHMYYEIVLSMYIFGVYLLDQLIRLYPLKYKLDLETKDEANILA